MGEVGDSTCSQGFKSNHGNKRAGRLAGYQAKDGAGKPKKSHHKNPAGAPDAAPATKSKRGARPVSDFGLQGGEIFQ
jgi:hypothetical protein